MNIVKPGLAQTAVPEVFPWAKDSYFPISLGARVLCGPILLKAIKCAFQKRACGCLSGSYSDREARVRPGSKESEREMTGESREAKE